MLVVDASALFELVASGSQHESVRTALAADAEQYAPELIDAEVGAVLQAHERRGDLDSTAARLALDLVATWPASRVPHLLLLGRAWELRQTIRFYDALYVALAERLEAPLLTLDGRLARAPGPKCEIIVPAA